MKKILLNLLFVVTIGFVNTDCNPFGSQMGKNPNNTNTSAKKPSVSKKEEDPFAHGSDVEDGSHGTVVEEGWPFPWLSYYDILWLGIFITLGVGIAQSYYTYQLWYNKIEKDKENSRRMLNHMLNAVSSILFGKNVLTNDSDFDDQN